MSNNCYTISGSALDDVRWERVDYIRLMLTSEAYPVPSEKVAAKLIEHMLERDRRNHSRSYGKTNRSSIVGEATIASKSETNDVKINAR